MPDKMPSTFSMHESRNEGTCGHQQRAHLGFGGALVAGVLAAYLVTGGHPVGDRLSAPGSRPAPRLADRPTRPASASTASKARPPGGAAMRRGLDSTMTCESFLSTLKAEPLARQSPVSFARYHPSHRQHPDGRPPKNRTTPPDSVKPTLEGGKMTKDEFHQLIQRPETETLDLKEAGYDLKKSRNKLTKDVLAMANTPREHSAYIVLGVRWTPECGSTVVGLDKQFDDVDLQNAFRRDHVQPTPKFAYSPLKFGEHQVGVLEVPISTKGPFAPIRDTQPSDSAADEPLQAGAFYYRCGTQNARATASEIREICNWFDSSDTSIPP